MIIRLKEINIKNFRQLKDLNIDFIKTSKHDLHIIIGKNGAGKTNLLNAINWCLYEEEPHLNTQSKSLPILNLNEIDPKCNGKRSDVKVEITIADERNKNIVFERKNRYKVEENKKPNLLSESFQVRYTDTDGNIHIHEDEKANNLVERFVPKGIREFFFFDGERLDTYFKEATAEKISQATFKISQIDLLERIEDKMNKITKELYREATKSNPNLKKINIEIDDLEDNIKEQSDQLNEIEKQIRISKQVIKECEDYLADTEDIEELERKRKQLNGQFESKSQMRKEKLNKKKDLLFQYGIIANMVKAIDKTVEIIKEKRKKNELPPNPNTDTKFLKEILDGDFCTACNRNLDQEARESIENLLNRIKISSESSRELMAIEGSLKNFQQIRGKIKNDLKTITEDINQLEKDLQYIEDEKNKIDSTLGSYTNKEEIKNKHEQRNYHEQLKERNLIKQGEISYYLKNLNNKLDDAKKSREKALVADQKQKKINKQIDFSNEAISTLSKSKQLIMTEVRQEIEKETKEMFFNLLWKTETYKDIKIDNKYNINLIHNMGYDCLGSASAAERALLALSFTLALHKVSNFDSPIIIDTPVSRISDENRKNFAMTLAKMSLNKQFFILFTPDEYSQDVRDAFKDVNCKKYKYTLSVDEKETKIEVL